jgi:uncharacterized protein
MLPRYTRKAALLAAGLAVLQGGAVRADTLDTLDTRDLGGGLKHAVHVESGRYRLAAALLLPEAAGPSPAVVFISGSRDALYSPTDSLPRRLVADGIAVLMLGKRGVGESTGDWRRESFDDRATDVLAAVEFLRRDSRIDATRVGLVAHSQGGWVAQAAAARDESIAFVVLLAGPGQSVRDQILTDERLHMLRRGADERTVDRRIARLRWQLGTLAATAPACRLLRAHYLCHIINFDPAGALARVRAPVLAVYGELDPMVPPDPNAELVRAGLERAGNGDVTILTFPAANHLFWEARTGLRDEYMQLEPRYVAGFVDTIAEWIAVRTR